MNGVPEEALFAVPVLAVFVGDLLKKFGLSDWIVPGNAILGSIVVVSMMGFGWYECAQGITLGLAGTGTAVSRCPPTLRRRWRSSERPPAARPCSP